MKYEDLEKNLRKQIETELQESGVSRHELNPEDVQLKKSGNKIEINYKDIEITLPAPSQEVIDSWWKDAGKYIAGGLIALAGVVVGGIIVSKRQD
ncbi:MAG: hypothetical protein KAW47_10360 [Thermoplasmatales archaeon]|nr:hypothetical protein [Thermoplasmatales archaeon]